VPSCAEGGVLGVLPGLIGTMQALEAIKLITGIGQPLLGKLLHLDTLSMRFRTLTLRRDPDCPVCGDHPTITQPIDYEGFCDIPKTPAAAPDIPAMTVHKLKELRDARDNHFLLDVREPHEQAICRIDGATLIPLGELENRTGELPKNKRILVHCKSGGRSARAVSRLRELGFNDVWNVSGGIIAWAREIDPKMSEY
jgi:adenylyltransferase/sulfurtransferase